MSKVLLFKSAYDHFPIGLGHVMSALRKVGMDYDFVDRLFPDSCSWAGPLARGEYLAVAAGGMSADFCFFRDLAAEVKAINPETPFILGGPINFDTPAHIVFDRIAVDYGVLGEAEITFPELLDALSLRCDPKGIPGVISRSPGGSLQVNPMRPWLDLRTFDTFPVWDDVNARHYSGADSPEDRAVSMPVLSARGCVGRCTFCSPTNGAYRMRRMEYILEEMHRLVAAYEFDHFVFPNELFAPTGKLIRDFCNAYAVHGPGKTWVCNLRVDIDKRILTTMRDAGCVYVGVGVESGSDRVLKKIGKNTNIEKIKSFVSAARSAGINAGCSFMLANETENEEEMAATVDLLIEEDIVGRMFSMVLAYPGTCIYRNAVASGLIEDEAKYIERLNYSSILRTGKFFDPDYVNVSAVPDSAVWGAALRQVRRNATYLLKRWTIRDFNAESGKGSCPSCGRTVSPSFPPEVVLGQEYYCPACFGLMYVDVYKEGAGLRHANMLREMLADARRIAIWGVGHNSLGIQYFDVLGLDPGRIVCCIDDIGLRDWPWFFESPVCAPDEVEQFAPDFALIADSIHPPTAAKLLAEQGVPAERVFSIAPPGWLATYENTRKNGPLARSGHDLDAVVLALSASRSSRIYASMRDQALEGVCAQVAAIGGRIALAPAGPFGQEMAKRLQRHGAEVIGFVDNFRSVQTQVLDGLPLFPPRRIEELGADLVFLATPGRELQRALEGQLSSYLPGLATIALDTIMRPALRLLPFFDERV
ncbi:MAG: radical SAM protein [Desulfovibrio sp.]|nr:radical SAM protein [Desulfovibrio sp.]MBI4957966.1 radical SAM protein [Desulfovibrio sp.]